MSRFTRVRYVDHPRHLHAQNISGVTSSVIKRPNIPAPIPDVRERSTGRICWLAMQQDMNSRGTKLHLGAALVIIAAGPLPRRLATIRVLRDQCSRAQS